MQVDKTLISLLSFSKEKGQDLTLLSFVRGVSSIPQWSYIFIRGLITLLP